MAGIEDIGPDSPTSPEMVRWAFLTILGREAGSDDHIHHHQVTFPTFRDLCNGLKDSAEFAMLFTARAAELSVLWPEHSHPTLKAISNSLYTARMGREPDKGEMTDCLVALRRFGGLAGVGPLAVIQSAVLPTPDGRFRATLPARPPAPWRLVGRDRQMSALMFWLLKGEGRRMFLDGAEGAGRATLAAEFGRRLTSAAGCGVLPGHTALDHILFVPAHSPDGAVDDPLAARIARAAGLEAGQGTAEDALGRFLDASNGLIIIDGPTDGPADEWLHARVLGAPGENKLLYTRAPPHRSVLDAVIEVPGFSDDAEYQEIFDLCAVRLGVPVPGPDEFAAIARWTRGLPARIERLFERRQGTTGFPEAMSA